jgi:hypothetical protein
MTDKVTIDRWLSNRQNEIDGATLYHTLAKAESQPPLVELYQRLAQSEEEHTAFWEEKLRLAGASLPPRRVSFRVRTLAWLARKFGPSFVIPTLATREQLDYISQKTGLAGLDLEVCELCRKKNLASKIEQFAR